MVEIRLYGKLRRYADDSKDGMIRIAPESNEKVGSLLNRLNIPLDDIYSIFYNSKLLAARSGMASWIGFQQVRSNPFDWDLTITVRPTDRIGLFGRDMAALVV